MKAPQLNRKLTLETPVRQPDGAGGYVESWQALGTHWASIKFGSGREKAGDFVTVSTLNLRITVRAAPEGAESRPRPDQRFVEGGREYRILAVADSDAVGRFLTCTAQEEVVT